MLEQSNETVEQPQEDSTSQDQVNEQPGATGEETQENAESVIEIDGEKLTPQQIKEYKEGYMRTQDYTKKTQELAEERRKLSRNESSQKEDELDPDVKSAVEVLKKAGVVTQEDLAQIKAYEEDQKQFKKLLKRHPELKAHERALVQIGKTDNRAWEDIVSDYGFISRDKLAKAKESKPVVGQKNVTPKQEKSISEMSSAEYALWKKKNLGSGLINVTN